MEKKSIFVMVSGPAASGKSTLVKNMSIALPTHDYKPAKAYIDLAKEKNISIDRAFYDIAPNDAEDYFCKVCSNHDITVGDQHLSIQHYKDSAIASGNPNIEFPDEPYVSAINYNLFNKLLEHEIQTLVIYLKASPQVLYERAYKRYLDYGTFMRNKNIKEVEDEVNAEYYYFNELIRKTNISSYVIDTDFKESSDVLKSAMKKTLKFKG